jgi:hypothetical protein
MFSVSFQDGTLISSARRIESAFPILGGNYLGSFKGNFFARPLTSEEKKVGFFPWGSTHELVYYDANF